MVLYNNLPPAGITTQPIGGLGVSGNEFKITCVSTGDAEGTWRWTQDNQDVEDNGVTHINNLYTAPYTTSVLVIG